LDLHRLNTCSKDMELVLNHSWDKSSEKNKNNQGEAGNRNS
jgi:hypothetical protein